MSSKSVKAFPPFRFLIIIMRTSHISTPYFIFELLRQFYIKLDEISQGTPRDKSFISANEIKPGRKFCQYAGANFLYFSCPTARIYDIIKIGGNWRPYFGNGRNSYVESCQASCA